MKTDYKITRNKFFDTEERRDILKYCENMALADMAKGRKTWQVRWMLVHLAMQSGLRVSEIADLMISDLKLKAKDPFIYVRKGKRGKDRDVYIDDQLTQHLKEFIEVKQVWNESVDADAPLFAGRNGSHYTTTALTLSFKQAVIKAGLRDDLSIHNARHTYATFLYSKTKDLRKVQKQLGHADTNMTSLYADILPEENGKVANLMILDEVAKPDSKDKPTMKRSASLSKLKQTAQELNEVLGLEPPIKTFAVDEKYLKAKLRRAKELIEPQDDMSPETQEVLDSLS